MRARGFKRVALMTDKVVAGLGHVATLRESLAGSRALLWPHGFR